LSAIVTVNVCGALVSTPPLAVPPSSVQPTVHHGGCRAPRRREAQCAVGADGRPGNERVGLPAADEERQALVRFARLPRADFVAQPGSVTGPLSWAKVRSGRG